MSDLTQLNKKAFDDFAASYDVQPWQKQLTAQLKDGLQARKDWIGAQWTTSSSYEVRLLDYACGTGAASIALQPYVTKIVGVDLSDGMVARYNEAFSRLGLSSEQAHAIVGDLTVSDLKSDLLEPDTFDVAIVSFALHHVQDPELLMKKLTAMLKPATGVLIIVDFLPFEHHHGNHDHKHGHMAKTINRHGFDEDAMAALYKHAELTNFGFSILDEKVQVGDKGNERTLFIARGRR